MHGCVRKSSGLPGLPEFLAGGASVVLPEDGGGGGLLSVGALVLCSLSRRFPSSFLRGGDIWSTRLQGSVPPGQKGSRTVGSREIVGLFVLLLFILWGFLSMEEADIG
ncbi:hypothetical protein J0A71_05g12130 [Encephalitozoon cuniculi]|nr:hypothetical protein J0A71_01g02420 [Encephalitozoon cuniculi]UYI26459.1 hypothetical protein J0A71_02g02840 [Encephalitozoon cuniculi]UYI27350.1 hypothetical protein J0A71_05g12130 [Encephalitozoon cuniculi]